MCLDTAEIPPFPCLNMFLIFTFIRTGWYILQWPVSISEKMRVSSKTDFLGRLHNSLPEGAMNSFVED